MSLTNLAKAIGLSDEHSEMIKILLNLRRKVSSRNELLSAYYEGDIEPAPIGIDTIPESSKPEFHCSWPQKAVTSVSERVRLDGFVFSGDEEQAEMKNIISSNNLIGNFNRHIQSILTHGCIFATINMGEDRKAKIRFHTADNAWAVWNHAEGRIAYGMVIANWQLTSYSKNREVPTQVNLYTPAKTVVINRLTANKWKASEYKLPISNPMMVAFSFRATGSKPFGQTRITNTVRSITDEVVRTLQNMSVAGALYSTPQKYLLGLSEEQFDELSKSKWSTYIGSVLLSTTDEEGNKPTTGQFSASSPQPFIDAIRTQAALFSGATGVPLNSLGIVQDNPSSAEAIAAAREDICIAAEDLIESCAESMREVALIAMAVENNKTIDGLTEVQSSVMAHFKDPSKPSIVSQADAHVKIASVRPGYADSDVFLENMGFTQGDIERVKSDEVKASSGMAIKALFGSQVTANADTA